MSPLNVEAVEAIFNGEFDGGNDSVVQTIVIDEDGDGTTFKRSSSKKGDPSAVQKVLVTVTHPGGKSSLIGSATKITFFPDKLTMHVVLDKSDADAASTPADEKVDEESEEAAPPPPASPRVHGWKIPFKNSQTTAQHSVLLQNVYKVCGKVIPMVVETEGHNALKLMCAEYVGLVGSSVTTGGVREERMQALQEETNMSYARAETDLIQSVTAHVHIRDEVLPDVMASVGKLGQMFDHIDVLEKYMADTLQLLDQLESAVSSHTAPPSSIVSMAKRMFSGMKSLKSGSQPSAHDILTISGLPPTEYELRLKSSLLHFHRLNVGQPPAEQSA